MLGLSWDSLIQGLRKTSALPFDARVRVWVEGGNGALGAMLAEHGARLRRDTLADEIALGAPPAGREVRRAEPASLGEVEGVVYLVMRAIIRIAHNIQRRLSIQSVELSNYIYKQHGRY